MKLLKISFFSFCLMLLFSCNSSNAEYGYNEKVTSIFLNQMNKIDETDSAFKDTSKLFVQGLSDSISLSNEAKNLINNSQMDIDNMAELKPSEDAKVFNDGVLNYLKAINNYGKAAQKVLQTKNINEKKKLHEQLMLSYEKLNKYPDSLLIIQKNYLSKVGLQPK